MTIDGVENAVQDLLLEFVEIVGLEDSLFLPAGDVDEVLLHPLQVLVRDPRRLDADGVDVDALVEEALRRGIGLGALGDRVDFAVRHHEEHLFDRDRGRAPIRLEHIQTGLHSLRGVGLSSEWFELRLAFVERRQGCVLWKGSPFNVVDVIFKLLFAHCHGLR